MGQFEFFMAFYGLLLGLGFAELLGGFANILRQKQPPRVGVVAPMLGVVVLMEMLTNFIDAWIKFQDIAITLPSLLIPTLIGLIYFVITIIVVPRDLDDWSNLDDYIALRRRWIVGLLIVANLLIISLEVTRIGRTFTGAGGNVLGWLLGNGWLLGSYLIVWWGRTRWLVIAGLLSVLLFYGYFYGVVGLVRNGGPTSG